MGTQQTFGNAVGFRDLITQASLHSDAGKTSDLLDSFTRIAIS